VTGGHTDTRDTAVREVIVGCNSKVWRAIVANHQVAGRFRVAIGHAAVAQFPFTTADRVWVFSYSRVPQENSRLFDVLEAAGVREVVYISSASVIVTRFTQCYEYPRVKQLAEDEARRRLNAHILTLGLVVGRIEELPSGRNVATVQDTIAAFLLAPRWPHESGNGMRLFEPVEVPFTRRWEAGLHGLYDSVQWIVRRWPCVLRPFDLVLRTLGIRWYGYVNLSNRLWITTTS
jgi:hypothetical protein